jgi:hypothetical protein
VQQASGSVFYADSTHMTPGYLGSYFAFLITNTNAAAGFTYASFGDVVGGKIALAPSQPAVLSAGYLATGASKMVYAYFVTTDSVDSTTPTNFSVKVWTFRPTRHSDSGYSVVKAFQLSVKDSIR